MRLSEYLDPENAAGFTRQTLGRLSDFGEDAADAVYNTMMDPGSMVDSFSDVASGAADLAQGAGRMAHDVMMDPGKMVGALTQMHPMDTAALATAFVPVVGDLTEGANLMRREYNDDESDNPAAWEYGLAAVPGGMATAGMIPKRMVSKYPKTGKPVNNVDKKTGKEFLGKGFSEDEKLLQKARTKVNKEIIKPGKYDEYFPTEDRYYADPSHYNLEGNTLTDTLAKTEAKRIEKVEQFDTPEARKSLNDAYDAGKGPLSENWYAMGQLQDKFIDVLGPVEGPKMYKERFADAMAATTGGADPGQNMVYATYGNYLKETGGKVPGNAYSMPHPVGGRFATGNMKMYDKVINEGKGLTPSGQPKRHNFSANFLGDMNRATIDEQMTSGMTGGKYNAPPNLTYGVLEEILGDEAAKRGINPANFQDVAWAGLKRSEGKPMVKWVNEMIERTVQVTGKTHDEVVEGFIRGNLPMYGAGGAATGLGILRAQEEEDDTRLQSPRI